MSSVTTKSVSCFCKVLVFVVFNIMVPIVVGQGIPSWNLTDCLIKCNGDSVLVCLDNQHYCLPVSGLSKPNMTCGCCKNTTRTLAPTTRPIEVTPTPRPIESKPTLKPFMNTTNPVFVKPTSVPTKAPIKPSSTKCNTNFDCKNPVLCGNPKAKLPWIFKLRGYLDGCACDFDINGKPVCWQNMKCSEMKKKPCSNVSPCPSGLVCVPDGTCCGFGGNFCMRPCWSKGPPYQPSTKPKPCPGSALGFCP